MQDIRIKADKVKKEFYLYLICLVIGCVVNIVSIVIFQTKWMELITQFGYVILISIVFYLVLLLFRVLLSLLIWFIQFMMRLHSHRH